MDTLTFGKIVAKAWTDPDFKNELLNNPRIAIESIGVDVGVEEAIELRIVENTNVVRYMVLPECPTFLPEEQFSGAVEYLRVFGSTEGSSCAFCKAL